MTDQQPRASAPQPSQRRLVGFRCMKDPNGGVIPLSAYSDPCSFDVPVYEEVTDAD